jgi:hypothetical protein
MRKKQFKFGNFGGGLVLTIVLVGLLLFSPTVQAQSLEWSHTIGGNSTDFSFQVSTTSTGDVYLSGEFYDTVDIDPGSGVVNMISNGQYDLFVAKFDSDGNYLWHMNMGGPDHEDAKTVYVDVNDNLIVSGRFSDTLDMDPSVGVSEILPDSGSYYLAKYDVNGQLIWAHETGLDANQVTIDDFGNILITGRFNGTKDFDLSAGIYPVTSNGGTDLFVVSYNGNAQLNWAHHFGDDSPYDEQGYGIDTDSLGNVYICGNFRDTVDFDPGSGVYELIVTGSSSTDGLVLKLDSTGNFIWAFNIGGFSGDVVNSIAILNQTVYAVGSFNDSIDLDPGVINTMQISNGGWDAFCAAYDFNGNYVWGKTFGGTGFDEATNIATTSKGNLFIAGVFQDSSALNPATMNQTFAFGGNDVYLSQFDPLGNYINSVLSGSVQHDGVQGLHIDANNNVYITGYFEDTITIQDTAISVSHSSAGSYDLFLAKYSTCLSADLPTITSTNVCFGDTTQLQITSGNLNDADEWSWYSNACNGTLIGTGTPLIYTPTATEVLFVKGTGGACAQDTCVEVMVIVNPVPQLTATVTDETFGNDGSIDLSVTGGASPYQFNWSNSATSEDISGLAAGTFTVIVTDANGCSASLMVTVTSVVGLNETAKSLKVRVYPNPTTGVVRIEASEYPLNITITDLLGRTLLTQRLFQAGELIDVSGFEAGTYQIISRSEHFSVQTQSLLKQ